MTSEQLKELEDRLWEAADKLRVDSGLKASEYATPILGLIFLRFASIRYNRVKEEIQKELKAQKNKRNQRAEHEIAIEKCGFFLPPQAEYDYLLQLPEQKNIAKAIKQAMEEIESYKPELQGSLPKDEYFKLVGKEDKSLPKSLLKIFKDIPEDATGDVFGKVYEYFLAEFALAEGQGGGEFFTPTSVVKLMVEIIEPYKGTIFDPACGSGGMFVQTGYFVKSHSNKEVNEVIKCYGTEQKTNNTKLAKINLAIHGIEGKIIEANSFYSDPHNLVGKCDFVMANPPFNVNKVDKGKDFVKTDPRLPFGLPKADNGNYLWIQYFHSYLNKKGRAGFVMASSATDAGHSEKLIRQQLIETGDVDCIVSVGNNFFYTRSLPCHVWFFDKGKHKENKKKILMIDARNVFRKVTTTINDFSEEQLEGLTAIVKLYRGEKPEVSKTNAWFNGRFPNKKYQDIEGLCKVVTLDEVKENDYSLTPGRYVGVKDSIDGDFDFVTRLKTIKIEFDLLNRESGKFTNSILKNLEELI